MENKMCSESNLINYYALKFTYVSRFRIMVRFYKKDYF